MWTDSYYPYISGVTRSVATTRDTLKRMGHDVSVFCPSYPGAAHEEGVYRFQSIKAPTKPDYYVAIPANPKHLIALNEISPEIIHIHSPFNLGKMGLRMGGLLGIPVVFTYHTMYNMYSHYIPIIGQMASELVESGAFITAKQVDAVIAPSTAIRDYLAEHNVRTRIFVIPTGIDTDRFRHGNPEYIREAFNIPSQVPVLLSCGRLGQEKNPETLVKAFALIQKSIDCFLVMVGDGPMQETLVKLAEDLGISHRIIFAGKLPPNIMPHMYAGSDVFLFSSVTDTQGLVIVEAKSAGVPCVAVGALGVKDMIENSVDGLLCENAPEDIAAKALALLEDPELLSTMKSNALANADKFSLRQSCAKLVECYMEIAQTPNAAL
ncbi:MAG TPA: glycosyltransferase family 4 protein [Firmicutes bacterium]|nr:glycosyltransferase family 4 protein [Candidatus Fermentithermobacillaceae bacterium]